MNKDIKIGIIIGSTREGRVSPQVAKWVLDKAQLIGKASYEIVDIQLYDLPFLGTSKDQEAVMKWNKKLSELDGFIFIASEYNHSISGALKNALDSARENWHNKAAGIISYGSIGGARAAEHLRLILGELMIADVRTQVLLSLFTDFKEFQEFEPSSIHEQNLVDLFNQVESWSSALKPLR